MLGLGLGIVRRVGLPPLPDVPIAVLMLGGEPLTLGGDYLTVGG